MQFLSIRKYTRALMVLVCLAFTPYHVNAQGTEIAGSPIFDGGVLNPGEAKISLGAFNVSKTGAATYAIPIMVPPGTAGMAPSLSLQYNSNGRNGLVGIRWSLGGLPAITRCGATVAQDERHGTVQYGNQDRFCMNGIRLINVSGDDADYGQDGTEYRTENDTFVKVVSNETQGGGPKYFEAWDKSGRIFQYGFTDDSRIEVEDPANTVRVWALNLVKDLSGNYMTITYEPEPNGGGFRPFKIEYTGNENTSLAPGRSVEFVYEPRPDDVIWAYRGGWVVKQTSRLKNIKTFLGTELVRDYRLGYEVKGANDGTDRSKLSSVEECNQQSECHTAHSFEWEKGGISAFDNHIHDVITGRTWLKNSNGTLYGVYNGDFNGDGLTDFVTVVPTFALFRVNFSNGDGEFTYHSNAIDGNWNDNQAWRVDYNGDGLADLVTYDSNKIHTYVSDGNGDFEHKEFSAPDWGGDRWVGDFNGDSRSDLMSYNSDNKEFRIYLADDWSSPTGIYEYRTIVRNNDDKLNASRAWVADVNGDGITDLVSADDDEFFVFMFQDDNLYNHKLTNIVGNWNKTRVWLGDYNGDGLTDLLTATSNPDELTVYFSKGDGTFEKIDTGAPVSAVWDNKDVWLGDFNADGKTDLVSTKAGNFNKFFSKGDGTFEIESHTIVHPWSNDNTWTGDVDGDGIMDLVSHKNDPERLSTHFSADEFPDHITTITTPIGGEFSITYEPLTNDAVYTKEDDPNFVAEHPERDIQAPFYVVATHTSSDGRASDPYVPPQTYQFSYQYMGLKNDLEGRGSLGFRAVRVIDDSGTNAVRTTYYRQDFPFTGLVDYTQTKHAADIDVNVPWYDDNGDFDTDIANDWVANQLDPDVSIFFASLEEVITTECKAGANCRTTSKTMEYDAYGNHERTVFLGVDSTTADDGEEITQWKVDADRWLHRPIRTAVHDHAGALLRETWFYYDQEAWDVLGSRGLLTKTEQRHDLQGNRGHADNPVTLQEYDSYGNTEKVTDPLGCETATVYDTPYHTFPETVTSCLTDTSVATTQFQWNEKYGVKEQETDPNGQVTSFQYDDFGRLTRVSGPLDTLDGTVNYFYDNWASNTVETRKTAYHGQGDYVWKKEYFDGLGRVWKVEHAPPLYLSTLTRLTEYDSRNLVARASAIYAEPETPVFTEFTYDVLGRVTEQVNFAGTVNETTIATDYLPSDGGPDEKKVVTITDENENVKRRYLDAFGRQVRVEEDNETENDTYVTTYVYDSLGQLKQITNDKQHVTVIGYDLLGRKTFQDEPGQPIWTYGYDKAGNLKSQTDAKGQTITYEYDRSGRIVKKTYEGLSAEPVAHFAFNGTGATIVDSTPNGHTGILSGTYERRPESQCWSGGCIWLDGVNGRGDIDDANDLDPGTGDFSVSVKFKPEDDRRMQVVWKGGASGGISFSYRIFWDPSGLVAAQYYSSTVGYWKGGYSGNCPLDEWCQVIMSWDRDTLFDLYVNGVLVASKSTSTEDGLNLTSPANVEVGTDRALPGTDFEGTIDELKFYNAAITPADETVNSIQWEYDDATVPFSKGRLTRVTDREGTEQYEYDALGRVTRTTREIDGTVYAMDETFDSMNRLATKTFDDEGAAYVYTYNRAGWPKSVTLFVDEVTYTPRGQIDQIFFSNDVVTDRDYEDNTFRLESILTEFGNYTHQDLSYQYDPKGNLERIDNGGVLFREFWYDDLDRLTRAEGLFEGTSRTMAYEDYEYDGIGNFTRKDAVTYLYFDPDHPSAMSSTIDSGVSTGYQWDANGNMTAKGGIGYSWDEDNRLIEADGATYAYDYTGRRLKKTSSSGTVRYPFSDYEVDENGGVKRYLSIAGQLVGRGKTVPGANELRFYHSDHLGGTHVITKDDGLFEQIIEYDPWGRVSYEVGNLDNVKKFTGQEFDEETGLYYYVARYYDPVLGRFQSPDPIVQAPFNPQNLNRYSYVLNNPVNFIDPTGNFACGAAGCVSIGFSTDTALAQQIVATMDAAAAASGGGFGGSPGVAAGGVFSGFGSSFGALLGSVLGQSSSTLGATGGSGSGGGQSPNTLNAVAVTTIGQVFPGATWPSWLTIGNTRMVLDVVGFIPMLSAPVAVIDAGLYIYESNYSAALTAFNPLGRIVRVARIAGRLGRFGVRTVRASKQARLRELADDAKVSSADRGWLRQEINQIRRGKRGNIRNPPGKDLAHTRGREAAKGFDHVQSPSNLQDRALHRTQHKFDNFGRRNRLRP